MSNALTQLVPVFNGANYQEWSDSIQSYLMSQGQWYVMTTTRPNDDTESTWVQDNLKAMGNIRLRVSPSIVPRIRDKTTALEMWDTSTAEYGKPGVSAAFLEFKAMLEVSIPPNAHPGPAM